MSQELSDKEISNAFEKLKIHMKRIALSKKIATL